MKTKMIVGTLAAMAMAAGQAQAAMLPLQNATITASYQGQAAGMVGVEHAFDSIPGSNVSRIDPFGIAEAEFITADYRYIVDFSDSGLLTVYINQPPDPDAATGSGAMRFDFGASLSAALTSFILVDVSALGAPPVLSLIDGHTIALDLGAVQWNGDFASFRAQLDARAPADVPEPASAGLLLAGMAGLAWSRRKRSGTARQESTGSE